MTIRADKPKLLVLARPLEDLEAILRLEEGYADVVIANKFPEGVIENVSGACSQYSSNFVYPQEQGIYNILLRRQCSFLKITGKVCCGGNSCHLTCLKYESASSHACNLAT